MRLTRQRTLKATSPGGTGDDVRARPATRSSFTEAALKEMLDAEAHASATSLASGGGSAHRRSDSRAARMLLQPATATAAVAGRTPSSAGHTGTDAADEVPFCAKRQRPLGTDAQLVTNDRYAALARAAGQEGRANVQNDNDAAGAAFYDCGSRRRFNVARRGGTQGGPVAGDV